MCLSLKDIIQAGIVFGENRQRRMAGVCCPDEPTTSRVRQQSARQRPEKHEAFFNDKCKSSKQDFLAKVSICSLQSVTIRSQPAVLAYDHCGLHLSHVCLPDTLYQGSNFFQGKFPTGRCETYNTKIVLKTPNCPKIPSIHLHMCSIYLNTHVQYIYTAQYIFL